MLTNLDNNLQKMPINDQIYLCKFNKKVMDILEKFVLIMKSTKIEIKELLIYKVYPLSRTIKKKVFLRNKMISVLNRSHLI